jgi:Ran GTPase-activating protein (RanGAP) involved in mRNA processing and transport
VSEDQTLNDSHVPLLTECPYLSRLEALDLTQHHIGPEGIRLLANSAKLPALCELDLYSNQCGDVGLRHIAASPLAVRLRKIHLTGVARGAPLTPAGMLVLAATPLPYLRTLRLESDTIRDAGARHLAGSAQFPALTELYLHDCGLTDAGVKAIAKSPHLKNLELLDLSSNWTVGHAGAVALVESPYLKHLRYLDLWRCERLSEDDEKMLRKRFRNRVNFARSY